MNVFIDIDEAHHYSYMSQIQESKFTKVFLGELHVQL